MWPLRVPAKTRPPAIVAEPEIAPRRSSCQTRAPESTRYAASTPPPLPATTSPPATAGVPFTGPLISTCQAGFRCLAASAMSVAPAGCPSRARSPRYIDQSPPACDDGVGELVPEAQAVSRTTATAPAARPRLIAAVHRQRARDRRLSGADPAMEEHQRTRSPPVGAAEESHHRRHDEDADDRGVDGDCDREADADGLDDHDVGKPESDEHGDHDRCGAGDEAAAFLEAQRHAGLVVAGPLVLLLDPADQQHLVVHRHPKNDAEEDDGDAGIDRLRREAEQPAQVTLLEDPDHRPE